MGKKKKNKELFEKYKILVAARNFHYENFNKWLTYFYVANAAIFVGYIQMISSPQFENLSNFQFPVLTLGFIAGLLLYWSSKGYYYWNINFIMLVNHYEKTLLKWKKKERIYSMFANKDEQNNYISPISGANFSTSKIAILFAFILATSWGSLLTYKLFSIPGSAIVVSPLWFKIGTAVSISIISILLLSLAMSKLKLLGSKTNPLHNLDIDQITTS